MRKPYTPLLATPAYARVRRFEGGPTWGYVQAFAIVFGRFLRDPGRHRSRHRRRRVGR